MPKLDKWYIVGTLGTIIVWAFLFYLLVVPNWHEREDRLKEAGETLQQLKEACAPKPAGRDDPATQSVSVATKQRQEMQSQLAWKYAELKKIEAVTTLDPYVVARAGAGGENNYFDQKRRELCADIDRSGIRLSGSLKQPGGQEYDLALRGELTKDKEQVPLNLVRLLALNRFLLVAKAAKTEEILRIAYPAPRALPLESGVEIEKLVQVPLLVSVRVPERELGQLLSGVQRPSDGKTSYFCLRGFQAQVGNAKSGTVEATLALSALLPKHLLTAEKISFKDEDETQRSGGGLKETVDPTKIY